MILILRNLPLFIIRLCLYFGLFISPFQLPFGAAISSNIMKPSTTFPLNVRMKDYQ